MSQLPGTIGLVATRGKAPAWIRLFTRGHWNHVVIAKGNGLMYEAEPGGVRLSLEDRYEDIAWLTNEPLSAVQRNARVVYLESMLDVPYNWPAILAFGPRFLTPSISGPFARWADARRNVICSELAFLAARASGTDWFPGRLAATVSPEDIDLEFRRRGW